ncbi:MAG: hypothetical protein AAGF97_03790 [Planctomycetota bacterium]
MRFVSARYRKLILVAAASVLACPAPADAVFNWLFPRRRQQVAYYYSPYGYAYYGSNTPTVVGYPTTNATTVWTQPQTTTFSPVGYSSLQACGNYTYRPATGCNTCARPVTTAWMPTTRLQPAAPCGQTTALMPTTTLAPTTTLMPTTTLAPTTTMAPTTTLMPTTTLAPATTAPSSCCSSASTVQRFNTTGTVANYGGYPTGYAFSPSTPTTSTTVPTSTHYPSSATTSNGTNGMQATPWTTVTPGANTSQQLAPVPADTRPTIDPQLANPQSNSGSTQDTAYPPSMPLQPIPYMPPKTRDSGSASGSGLSGEYSDLDWLKRDVDGQQWQAVPISWDTQGRPPAARLLPPESIRRADANARGSWQSLAN